MTDKKITQVTVIQSAAGSDLIPLAIHTGTVPEAAAIPISGLFASPNPTISGIQSDISTIESDITNLGSVDSTGWVSAGETWTYASATTFTIAGDKTTTYTAGVKLKLTNSTVKYFYVVSSSYNGSTTTTVTITGGSDYALAAGAISANYYSRVSNPQGFPHWFNYVPTLTGGNADLSGYDTARFCIIGKVVELKFLANNKTLSGTAGQINISLPVPGVSQTYELLAACYDAGTAAWRFVMNAISTDLIVHKTVSFSNWAATETEVYIAISGSYEMV